MKSTEIWKSPAFQALLAQQQAIETDAGLEARRAQLDALMKRVAAEKRLPIEDIKRAVNEMAHGLNDGGGPEPPPALPPLPPGQNVNPLELQQGEEVLQGDAMAALTQFVAQQAAIADQVALLPELRAQQPVRSEIEDAHAPGAVRQHAGPREHPRHSEPRGGPARGEAEAAGSRKPLQPRERG